MGTKQSKHTKSPQILGTVIQDEHYYDQVIQTDECCGFVRHRTVKKRLVWEDNFMINCQDLQMYYEWVHDLEDAVKMNSKKMPRKKFIDQFNALKTEGAVQPAYEKEILLSPSEIDQFKINLKNSVLLSYGQALKPPKPKQNSKIQSIMMFSPTSKHPQKSTQHPASYSKSEMRRSGLMSGEHRKQSILRQRQRALRQSFSKTGFRQSLMSFVDDTMSSLFRGQQKQISKQSAQALEVFVKFSLILEKHLNDKENIINCIIEAFQNYIYKKYPIFNSTASEPKNQISEDFQASQKEKESLQIEQIEQKWINKVKKDRFKLENRKNLTVGQIQELTTDIKMFLLLLRETVEDYYKTTEFIYYNNSESHSLNDESFQDASFYGPNTNFLITNQDNILILVTAILFKDEKFYNHIFNLFRKFNEERERNFKKILASLEGQPPQYFQIKREYCLNEYTLEKCIKEDKKNSTNHQQKTKNFSNQKQASKQKDFEDRKQHKSLTSKSITESVIPTTSKPYMKCVQSLSKLAKSKTPTSKMKTIMECSQKITESLSEFYKSNQIQLKSEVLDADQILSIFCYILSINSLENLHSHLFMIEHFATQNQMISITGYYYSVLTCALEQLQNMYSSTVADSKNESINNITSRSPSKALSHRTLSPKKDLLKRSFKNN